MAIVEDIVTPIAVVSGMGAAISDGIVLTAGVDGAATAVLVVDVVVDCEVIGDGFAGRACAEGTPDKSAAGDVPLKCGSARG